MCKENEIQFRVEWNRSGIVRRRNLIPAISFTFKELTACEVKANYLFEFKNFLLAALETNGWLFK